MSIAVKNIIKSYGGQAALNNISFDIPSGQVVGLLGPNGAGKSTLMKILTGYIPQTSGVAKVCDFDVSTNPLDVQRRIGYLPEHNPLYLDMYVKEYLQFVAGSYGAKKGEVDRVIDLTGITQEAHKKLGDLSKGYRQRVGLAAALIHDPEVLILDEPTTGLDPNQLVQIRALIKEIGKEKTVILSTHIMQEVEDMCSRVIIINKGNIVADTPISELKELSGKAKISIVFSNEVPVQLLKKLGTVISVVSNSATAYQIETLKAKACKQQLFEFAVKNGVTIEEVKETAVNLEGIFHELTAD